MLDDAEIRKLLLRVAARDGAAFATLYRQSAALLLGVSLRIVHRREIAEEVVHDTFLKIWRLADTFDPLAPSPVAWIVAIARNRAIDLVSAADTARVDSVGDDAEKLLDRLYDWNPQDDDPLDSGRAVRWLRACLDELKPGERQAIVLAYLHGLSHGALAIQLRCPLGTVKTWVRQGLGSLRGCVEQRRATR